MVGRTLEQDLEQRCHEFLRVLMARKNLSYGSVWIRDAALRRKGDDRKVKLIAALPSARVVAREISADSPSMAVLGGAKFHVVRDRDPDYCTHVLESKIDTGSIASLRLGSIGVLRLHSFKQNSFTVREINQLVGVVEIFSISIEGALAQRRLKEEAKERELIEEQLQQNEKLKAIGQLTGGVAHDFNNLLAVISGSAELLKFEGSHDEHLVRTILRAAQRGAELTHRLLAYSRQQPLRTKSIDLSALVDSMSGVLGRTLGETIEISTIAAPDLWYSAADPGQVETALLNLAINARDAMPRGGKLLIECQNVHLQGADQAENPEALVGDFVMLAVCDNGTGMAETVRAHAFEPFFTTKDVGKGSGLGLSMVYGFAKQSGGQVTIASEEGRGTTVRLYLPRHQAVPSTAGGEKPVEIPRGRGETILVVEDDVDARTLTVLMLENLGYRTVDVPDAARALATLTDSMVPDLVLSDVRLPGGIRGTQLAKTVCESHPGLKFIFMSGHPAEASQSSAPLGCDQVLLNKPFQRQQLAKALRQVLD